MFRNQIIWYKKGGPSHPSSIPHKHDTIYWYSNGISNPQTEYRWNKRYEKYNILKSVWDDIQSIGVNTTIADYPTQKPYKLLERIICLSTL